MQPEEAIQPNSWRNLRGDFHRWHSNLLRADCASSSDHCVAGFRSKRLVQILWVCFIIQISDTDIWSTDLDMVSGLRRFQWTQLQGNHLTKLFFFFLSSVCLAFISLDILQCSKRHPHHRVQGTRKKARTFSPLYAFHVAYSFRVLGWLCDQVHLTGDCRSRNHVGRSHYGVRGNHCLPRYHKQPLVKENKHSRKLCFLLLLLFLFISLVLSSLLLCTAIPFSSLLLILLRFSTSSLLLPSFSTRLLWSSRALLLLSTFCFCLSWILFQCED